jgi:diacylglycerol kinase (ATP)
LENVTKIKNAFFYSLSGIRFLLNERAFKQEILIGVILIFVEFLRNTSFAMFMYIFSSYILVLVLEAINSAIESAIDRIGPSRHPLSKRAKDMGSAAVLIALLHLITVWVTSWFI